MVPLESAAYAHVGVETIDGAACWIVLSKPRRRKLWFDQESGRLVQMLNYIMEGAESAPFHKMTEVEKLSGRKFETLDAFREFAKGVDQAARQRMAGLYGLLYFDELARPVELNRFSDYREIAPGIWFPRQAIDVFAGRSPTNRNKFRFSRGRLRVTVVKTGQPLEETNADLMAKR